VPASDPLPPDILERLSQDFGDRAEAVASLLLNEYPGDWLVRCILWLAKGDEQRVQQLMERARMDVRDVLWNAQEDLGGRRVRDLSVSFLIDSPEKLWISFIANMMETRGYRLTSLETRSATAGPFEFIADYSEGTATFVGPKGQFQIEKKDGQWTIRGKPRDLEVHEMNHPFDDERVFSDAVWSYLLSDIVAKEDDGAKPACDDVRRPWWCFWK
jgi:hypothetical protein